MHCLKSRMDIEFGFAACVGFADGLCPSVTGPYPLGFALVCLNESLGLRAKPKTIRHHYGRAKPIREANTGGKADNRTAHYCCGKALS